MTDERYVYTQDQKERSKTKNGAYHKKNRSKSKKCSFPSDYLTVKEKKKLNGPCESIDLSKPIKDIRVFRRYPSSLQQEYLQNLIDKYGARKQDICDMFGTSASNFNRYCDNHGIQIKCGPRRRNMDERFAKFINCTSDNEHVEEGKEEKLEDELFTAPANQNIVVQATADALYIKTLYDRLVEFGFSDDFSKQIILQRSRSSTIHF